MLFAFDGVLRHVQAVDERLPVGGLHKAKEAVDGGGFAGAVLPQQAKDFALGDVERQLVEGDFFTVVFGKLYRQCK